MELFRGITLWKRISEYEAIRYSCLQDLETGMYAVQSADYFRVPLEEKQFHYFEKQFVELFMEIPVRERCEWFAHLEEAVKKHDQEFA